MKNILIINFLLFFSFQLSGQSSEQISGEKFAIGDTYFIGQPSGQDYNHIKFPRRNFIMKRGGLPNYKNLIGKEILVTGTRVRNDRQEVTIKRMDGLNFFGSYPEVKVDIENAIQSGELIRKE